jgi:hypothetical protein
MNIYYLPKAVALGLLLLAIGMPSYAQIYSEQMLPNSSGSQNTIVVKSVDIDNDGDQDLILGNEFQQNSVSFNLGNGDFVTGNNGFSNELNDTDDIGLGDFDGDGDIDIIFINQGGFGHEYYENDGNGNFSIAGFLPATNGGAIAVGDVNNDGFLDVIIGNLNQVNFCLINNGDGSFTNETTDRLPGSLKSTDHALLEDIDGDGDLDLFFANRDGNELLINDGNGVFEDQSFSRLPQGVNMDTRKACFGDVNNDGKPDLFLANVQFNANEDPQNRLYINESNGFFTDLTAMFLPQALNQTTNAAFHDIDQNGTLDLFITNVLADPLQAFLNDGTGKFTERTNDIISPPVMTDEAWGLAIADFNNDDFSDIYVASRMGLDAYLPGDPEGMIPLSTQNVLLNGDFIVFPNPVINEMYLEHPENFLAKKIEIYSAIGHLIQNAEIHSIDNQISQIALKETLPNGFYFLKLENEKSTISLKFKIE